MRSFLVGMILLLGCSRSPTGPVGGLVVVPHVPATVRVGENLLVRVVVTNHDVVARTIIANSCPRPFIVKDQRGEWVDGPAGQICTADLRTVALRPGHSYEFVIHWTVSLEPGSYTVEGWVREEERSAQPEGTSATFEVIP